MSKLKVTTIANVADSESTDVTNVINGSAKAWVNFDGTFGTSPFTVANGGIRAAFNVSSVTDNGTGDYTVNFATAMADANYAPSVTPWSNSDVWGYIPQIKASATPTTAALRIYIIAQQGATTTISDIQGVNIAIFR
jgi:hypothetical protein